MIRIQTFQYDFSRLPFRPVSGWEFRSEVFCLAFSASPARMRGELFRHGAGVRVRVCDGIRDLPPETCRMQNYAAYALADGSCPVLAAELYLAGDDEPWHVGFPLAMAGEPEEEKQFHAVYDGVTWRLFCNGALMDQDYPLGNMAFSGSASGEYRVSPVLLRVGVADSLGDIRRIPREIVRAESVMHYTPEGFNTWVGDVVTYTFNDTFYIFYLLDRRHHGSRRGKGAHIFCMLTSRDLVNWVDHGPVMELDTQWQSIGTGTAFTCDGKLHLSYGFHTGRVVPAERCAGTLLRQYFRENGHTGLWDTGDLGDYVPGGGTYAVSEDGIHFTPSGKWMHYLENPSVFENPDGTFSLIQEGVWHSDHLGDWVLKDPDFPPHDEASFARNCLDCPNFYTLGGWEYLAVGFTGFFGRPQGDGASEWIDFTARGWEPYDGVQVPMAAPFRGRVIEGGWIRGAAGWGSCLLLRELLPLGGGRIGKRWLPETLPEWKQEALFCDTVEIGEESVMLEISCIGDRAVDVVFTGDGAGCCFRLDPQKGKAGFVTERGAELAPVFREYLADAPEVRTFQELLNQPWKIHFWGEDYTRENLVFPDGEWRLRILLNQSRKMNGVLIDVEIAGRYTLASYRYGERFHRLTLAGGVCGQNIKRGQHPAGSGGRKPDLPTVSEADVRPQRPCASQS